MKKLTIILSSFLVLTSFTLIQTDIWENDGPYPGDVCASTTHPGHKGLDDSQWRQMEIQKELYHSLQRNNHLKSADFFDAQKYPSMHFKSTSLEKYDKNKYKLTGDLTLHGITKPVTMDLEYRGTVENPMSKKPTAGFQLTGVIKRSDFAIGNGFPPPMISDEVRIKADGEFLQ